MSLEHQKLAFRCKTCGKLHEAGHAGESPHPHACCVCGGGVLLTHHRIASQLQEAITKGEKDRALALVADLRACNPSEKAILPENWEVLADVVPARLEELGLKPEHITKHVPWPKPDGAEERSPKAHVVGMDERLVAQDAQAAKKN